MSCVTEQRRRDALRVAAVAQLAVELVDEVAAVGEDQDAAGARGLDEADGGDGLARAGRVLEPEALAGVRVLGGLGDVLGLGLVRGPLLRLSRPLPRPRRRRGVVGVEHGLGGIGDRRSRRSSCDRRAARSACPTARRPGARTGLSHRPGAAPPARAGGPARAAATTGGASAATGPSRRPRARRARSPARGAAACRRASADAASSPSVRKGSRANADARSISSIEGSVAGSATGVVSAKRTARKVAVAANAG